MRGGGDGFLIENSIEYELLELETSEIITFEYCKTVLSKNTKYLNLICIYRPLGIYVDNFTTELELLITTNFQDKHILLTGDLNIKLLNIKS